MRTGTLVDRAAGQFQQLTGADPVRVGEPVEPGVHRMPDRLSYPAAAGTWALLRLTGAGPAPWLRATLAGLGLALGFAATTLLLGRRGFGLGDAKLALSVGALLGWPVLLAGLVLAFAR